MDHTASGAGSEVRTSPTGVACIGYDLAATQYGSKCVFKLLFSLPCTHCPVRPLPYLGVHCTIPYVFRLNSDLVVAVTVLYVASLSGVKNSAESVDTVYQPYRCPC